MKFNLKNRPKPFGDPTKVENEYVAIETYLGKLDKWFEGFERELVEKLRSMEPRTIEHLLIQEILGEILGE